ncbi:RNA polymerase sigma-70 factor (sigma-E family) [Nocardioides thalensis]|uniref:RNA polymerase sigma-70 factor (Sigma-E family) n=1 Tax=Nocardioides thalensis TaxID=1914755 RepID=A0A853C5K6_9ACTN|nr:RNA polymerase sigma-70 factor (sigma-E family) [Nocardioides thalensis]
MKRNDNEEFAAFVRETATALHRAALLLTGDHHQAEDLTQATYVRVLASWRRTSAAESPLAYARTTMLNTFLSHRRLRRSSEAPVADLAVDQPVADGDPDTRIDLLVALASLAPLDRAVVVLRYWEDRSVADTAVDLQLTEVNVRARSRRALQRLRPLLDRSDLTERTP